MYSNSKKSIIELVSKSLVNDPSFQIIFSYDEGAKNVSGDEVINILQNKLNVGNVILLEEVNSDVVLVFKNEEEAKQYLTDQAKFITSDYDREKEYDWFYENILRNIVPLDKQIQEFDPLAYCLTYEMFVVEK